MRKAIMILMALMFTTGTAWAGGDKNHGDVGQGATGTEAQGAADQTRGG